MWMTSTAWSAYLGEAPTTSPPAANERNNARLAGCPAGVRPDKRLCHMGDERIELRLLKPFGIGPKTVRADGGRLKGGILARTA